MLVIAATAGVALPAVESVEGIGADLVMEDATALLSLLSLVCIGAITRSDEEFLRSRIKGQYSGAYRLKAEKSSSCPHCGVEMRGTEVVNVLVRPSRGSSKQTQWWHLRCALEDRRVPAVKRRSRGNPNEANRLIVYSHAVASLYEQVREDGTLNDFRHCGQLTQSEETSDGLCASHHPDVMAERFPAAYAGCYVDAPRPKERLPKKEGGTPDPLPESPTPLVNPTHDAGLVGEQGNVIFSLIAPNIEAWATQFTGTLRGEMREQFDLLVAEVKDIASMQPFRLTVLDSPTVVFDEMVHAMFHRLLRNCRTKIQGRRLNSLLVGPAGSGKTFAAKQIARALRVIPSELGGVSRDAAYCEVSCNEDMTPSQITGATVPNITDGLPVYTMSKVVETYMKGGIILFDEFDRLRAGTAVALNGAIAGTDWALPDGSVASRHEDTVFVMTANTFGHGGNRKYTAANKLDGATLNRFASGVIEWGYDEVLEKMFCPNVELRELLQDLRDKMNRSNIQRIISPRHLQGAYAMVEIHSLPVMQAFYEALADWNENDLKMVGLDPTVVHAAIMNYEEAYTVGADLQPSDGAGGAA